MAGSVTGEAVGVPSIVRTVVHDRDVHETDAEKNQQAKHTCRERRQHHRRALDAHARV
jgi:hypothetical protein